MKLFIYAYMLFFTLVLALNPIAKTTLKEGEDCGSTFLKYLNEQDRIITSKDGSIYLNLKESKMSGYAMSCDKNNVELFYLHKSGDFETEVEFLAQYLFHFLFNEDIKTKEKLAEYIEPKASEGENDIKNANNQKLNEQIKEQKSDVVAKVEEQKINQEPNIKNTNPYTYPNHPNEENSKNKIDNINQINPINKELVKPFSEMLKINQPEETMTSNLSSQTKKEMEKVSLPRYNGNDNDNDVLSKMLSTHAFYSHSINELPFLNIYIYLPKTPCIFCYYAYLNLIKKFKNISLHIYYSSKFNFNNINILLKKSIKSLPIYQQCTKNSKPAYSPNCSRFLKKIYNNSGNENDYEILNCINDKTYLQIVNNHEDRISFHKIVLHTKYDERINKIFNTLMLTNDRS